MFLKRTKGYIWREDKGILDELLPSVPTGQRFKSLKWKMSLKRIQYQAGSFLG